LQANISALQQSSQNATAGVGQLQVADGALSQVTSLLNRAVTLATQAANGGLTTAQFSAITNEYGSITSEINRIGAATNFNGTQVFSSVNSASTNQVATTATSAVNASSLLTAGQTSTVQLGNNTAYTFTAGGANANIVAGSAGSLTTATALANNHTITVGNGTNTVTFTAATSKYSGGTATSAGASTSALDNITITSANSATTSSYTFTAGDKVSNMLTALNANTATNGISAYLDASGKLQIQGTAAAGNLTISTYAGTGVSGALTGTQNTVGDLMTAINTSGYGLTASLDASGHFSVVSNSGVMTLASGSNMTELGTTLTATNTVQSLINGINASGLGVTASLVSVTNPNEVVSANGSLTGAGAITAGGTLTITSGTAVNGVSPNTFTYTASASTPDTVAGTAGNNTVQGLIDAINTSGTPFHAYLDSSSHLQITDSSYSGNIATSGSLAGAGTPGAFASAGAIQQLEITDPQTRGNLAVQSNDVALGFVASTGGNPLKGGNADAFAALSSTSGNSGASVFISDGQVSQALYNTIKVAVGALSATQIGSNTTTLQSQNLGTAATAASALTVINSAISNVAAMRGTIGAGINRLNSATNVINTQVQNLTSAQSSMQDADVGQVVANMSKYQVLEQTGISALAQSNQNEQAVLKLLQ
jgi:flagellin